MGKEKCRSILTGKTICSTPNLFAEGNLGRGPFQAFLPTDLIGLTLWLDDPAIPSNIIEDGSNRVSQWTDQSGEGNHFTQSTGADQPLHTGQAIILDGVSEFLSGTAHIANFASDNEGEIFFVANRVVNAFTVYLTLSKAGTAFRFQENINDALQSLVNNAGPVVGTIAPNDFGTNRLHNFSSDGSDYLFEYDGASDAISSGTDNGNWFADIAGLTDFNLGHRINIPNFNNISLSTVVYYNRRLTVAERLQVTTFLNDRFSL